MHTRKRHHNQAYESWIWTLLIFINPLRGPGILIAILATFFEEVGQDLSWYAILFICLTNLLAIRLISLIIMDTVCICLDLYYKSVKIRSAQQKSRRNSQLRHRTIHM